MHHSIPLITTLAAAFGLALLFGFLAARLKLPVLVGYLFAGIIIGPFTPGFVADANIARELAEIGVMLLMFGVGLHFSLNDLLTVRKVALPGAVLQIIAATALGAGVASFWGWSLGGSLVFGLSLSVASTVVLLRALEAHHAMDTMNGRIAVGWLVVEDLAMVLVIVLLPPLATWLGGKTPGMSTANLWPTLGLTLLKISAFIALMMLIGRKIFPKILWQIAATGYRELFTLGIVAAAISVAYIAAKLFGVSFALGAFFAGMMMRESVFNHRVAEDSLPLRELFTILFFVSVGMLFDPMVLVQHPLQVLTVLGIIILGKTAVAAGLVLFLRYPLNTALIVSASLAQIGEFSFILAELGVSLGLLPGEGQSLILAGALISIAINPLLFKAIEPLEAWISGHAKIAKLLAHTSSDPLAELPTATHEKYLSGQVILVGYRRVGRRVAELLTTHKIPYIVIDQNREIVEQLRANNVAAVSGDASDTEVLTQAHAEHASMLISAISDTLHISQMIEAVRVLNPKIELLVRTHNEEETSLLLEKGVEKVFLGEDELAKSIGDHVLARYGKATK